MNTWKRRMLALGLSAVMLLPLTACSQNTTESNPMPSSDTVPTFENDTLVGAFHYGKLATVFVEGAWEVTKDEDTTLVLSKTQDKTNTIELTTTPMGATTQEELQNAVEALRVQASNPSELKTINIGRVKYLYYTFDNDQGTKDTKLFGLNSTDTSYDAGTVTIAGSTPEDSSVAKMVTSIIYKLSYQGGTLVTTAATE